MLFSWSSSSLKRRAMEGRDEYVVFRALGGND